MLDRDISLIEEIFSEFVHNGVIAKENISIHVSDSVDEIIEEANQFAMSEKDFVPEFYNAELYDKIDSGLLDMDYEDGNNNNFSNVDDYWSNFDLFQD